MATKQTKNIKVRCTEEEKEAIRIKWKKYGFESESEYIRFVALNAEIVVRVIKDKSE